MALSFGDGSVWQENRSGLQPSVFARPDSWGVAPGWYGLRLQRSMGEPIFVLTERSGKPTHYVSLELVEARGCGELVARKEFRRLKSFELWL